MYDNTTVNKLTQDHNVNTCTLKGNGYKPKAYSWLYIYNLVTFLGWLLEVHKLFLGSCNNID